MSSSEFRLQYNHNFSLQSIGLLRVRAVLIFVRVTFCHRCFFHNDSPGGGVVANLPYAVTDGTVDKQSDGNTQSCITTLTTFLRHSRVAFNHQQDNVVSNDVTITSSLRINVILFS